jgi:16S rRNA (guanine1207-N2)-methyltransferase
MHYYTNNVDAQSSEKEFEYTLKGQKLKFITDIGVFSKTGVDFGSRLLIETFTESDLEGKILDVGCGYGPIGLTLAKVYPNRDVNMVDVNLRAIELSKRNAQINKISNVKVFESFCYENVEGAFAAVVSNPPIRAGKRVVHAIIEEAKEYLLKEGELWIVIQKKQGAPSAQKKMMEIYGNCEVIDKEKGYFILMSKKH